MDVTQSSYKQPAVRAVAGSNPFGTVVLPGLKPGFHIVLIIAIQSQTTIGNGPITDRAYVVMEMLHYVYLR